MAVITDLEYQDWKDTSNATKVVITPHGLKTWIICKALPLVWTSTIWGLVEWWHSFTTRFFINSTLQLCKNFTREILVILWLWTKLQDETQESLPPCLGYSRIKPNARRRWSCAATSSASSSSSTFEGHRCEKLAPQPRAWEVVPDAPWLKTIPIFNYQHNKILCKKYDPLRICGCRLLRILGLLKGEA